MVKTKITLQKEGFKEGIREGIGIGISYLPFALAYGIAATKLGINFFLSNLLSGLVQSGTGQLTILNLIENGETMLFAFMLSLFIINCRYILFSISIGQRLEPGMNAFKRILFGFFNTDEIFAMAMQKQGLLKFSYLMGLAVGPFLGWMLGSIAGTLFTDVLPASIISALGIAVYGIFVFIIIPAAKKSKPVLFAISLAAAIHVILQYIPNIKQNLSGGNILIITTLVSAVVSAIVFPAKADENEEELAEELSKEAGNDVE